MIKYLFLFILFNLSCISRNPANYDFSHIQKFKNFVFLQSEYNYGDYTLSEANASGVIYRVNDGLIYILTAAHFCSPGSYEIQNINESQTGHRQIWVFNENTKRLGMVFKIDTQNDLCMIVSIKKKSDIFENLKFAKKMPRIGEKIYNSAAPDGIASPDIKLLLDGYYSGSNFGPNKYSLYTIPATFGSSGSAVYNKKGEIISIIVAADPNFENISMGPNIYNIRKFVGEL